MKTSANIKEKENHIVFVLFYMSYKTPSFLKEYKRKSELLSRALKESKSVKILTKNETVLNLVNLSLKAGKFFGLNTIKGKMEEIRLNINEIKTITML